MFIFQAVLCLLCCTSCVAVEIGLRGWRPRGSRRGGVTETLAMTEMMDPSLTLFYAINSEHSYQFHPLQSEPAAATGVKSHGSSSEVILSIQMRKLTKFTWIKEGHNGCVSPVCHCWSYSDKMDYLCSQAEGEWLFNYFPLQSILITYQRIRIPTGY